MKKEIKNYLLRTIAGRKNFNKYNFLENLPDPDKILEENGYDYSVLRDLLEDPHLAATIQQRKNQVLQMGWEIENVSNTELKNQAVEIIAKLDLKRIGSEILDAINYGFQVSEIEWQIKDNKIMPVDIIGKPQEWFIYSRDNELLLRKKVNGFYIYADGEKLPEHKFIVSQHSHTYTNPYGEKLLSKVFWPVTLKKTTRNFWQAMIEKYGMPYLVSYYAAGASETEKQDLIDSINEIVENQGGLLPADTLLDFKESPKYDVGQLYKNLIDHYNNEISKAILTETLTIEVSSTGSYKIADIHREMLEYLGISDKKLIELGINKVLKSWCILNYGEDVKDIPKLKLKKKEKVIESSAGRDKTLTEMGVVFTEQYYRKRYNLTEKDFKLIKTER